MPRKATKYTYWYVLQGNYGYGWDDLTQAPKTPAGRKEIRQDKKDYRENEPHVPHRIIERRERR
jgi:hypothetical protein